MSKVTQLTLDEGGGLSRKRIHLREISGDADAPLETVGQDLRAGRLRLGEDLATVGRALKIRKDHLEALEEDRFEALPGRTYAIGFVRSYADYLGLDPVEAVERFKNEIAGRDDKPKVPVLEEPQQERRMPEGWIIIGAVLVVAIAFGAWRLVHSADALLNAPVAAVPSRIAPPLPKAKFQPPPPKHVQQTALPATQPATAGVAAPPANAALPGIVPSGAAAPGTQVAQAPAAPSQPLSLADEIKALPPGRVWGERNHDPRVILRALRPVRVVVTNSGPNPRPYLLRTLQPGDTYRVPDVVGLTMETQDAGALAVELDGQLLGRAGSAKQIIEAQSLDPQALIDRYSHAPQQ